MKEDGEIWERVGRGEEEGTGCHPINEANATLANQRKKGSAFFVSMIMGSRRCGTGVEEGFEKEKREGGGGHAS